MTPSLKKTAGDLEDRIRFETLLADLSARFVSLPSSQVDAAIEDSQRRICACLDLDISSLWQIDEEYPGTMFLMHHCLPPGSPPVPKDMNALEVSPWSLEQLRRGETIALSRVEEAPAVAAKDLELWRQYSIKSVLTLPLSTGGGTVFGALNFCAVRKEQSWSPVLISRLQLVAQVFSNALARRHNEALVKHGEERLNLVTSAADIGLWILNAARTHFWINEKKSELFGLPPQDRLELSQFMALVHAEDRPRVNETLFFADGSAQMASAEYRIVRPDGQVRWMVSRGRAVAADETSRLMGITIDVTGRKRAASEAEELRRELAHITRVSTLGELAASIAHELNQPLGAILRNAEAAELFLNEPDPDLDEVRAILADIRKDDQRAGAVIDRMRGLIKRRKAELRILDAGLLANDAAAMIKAEAELRHVQLIIECAPCPMPVLGDRVQLQQVLLNLLINAMDASMDKPPAERLIAVRIRMAGGCIEIAVTDRGHGISPDQLDRIFEPFFTTKSDGLGMGLAITCGIVEAHGGRLRTENNETGGATFTVILPVAQQDGEK